MTKIKMCGLRRPEDIEYANMLLPEYIGYVFAKKSRRYVAPETAEKLTELLSTEITPVGVFVDEPIENVIALVESGAIRMAQLHGNESEEYVAELQSRSIPVIRAFKVSCEADIDAAGNTCADYVLLDSGSGSGETFDWSLIKNIGREFFLAGGLTADNAGEAVKTFRPYAVDASSCLETEGVKDFTKMKAFAEAIRNS